MNRPDAVFLMYEYYRQKGYTSQAAGQMIASLCESDVDGLVAYVFDQAIDHYEVEIKKQLGQMGFLPEDKDEVHFV